MSCKYDISRSVGYADDIGLVAPSIYFLIEMVNICEQLAHEYHIRFNQSKSKLTSFNLSRPLGTPIFLNGQNVEVVDNDSHLGNYVATDLRDINITKHVCSTSAVIMSSVTSMLVIV